MSSIRASAVRQPEPRPAVSAPVRTVDVPAAARRPARGYWSDVGRRLRRDRMAMLGGAIIGLFVAAALAAPLLAPYPYDAQVFDRLLPPSLQNLLGTDDLGRDQFSRLVYGARISLYVGLISQAIILAVGLPLGLISGYYGGKSDAVIMRLTEVVLTLPTILLARLSRATPRSDRAPRWSEPDSQRNDGARHTRGTEHLSALRSGSGQGCAG